MAARPFRCPPEFVAADPAPPPELCGAALGGGSTELWLIRAPATFRPESLQGCSVPLDGCGWLHPPGDIDGDGRPYRLRGGPDCTGGGGAPLLLAPQTPGGALSCAPPLRGCLTITESCGEPPPEEGTRRRKKRKKRRKEQPPDEGGGSPGPPQTLGDPEGPEPPRRKKKKRHKDGEDAADPLPPQ